MLQKTKSPFRSRFHAQNAANKSKRTFTSTISALCASLQPSHADLPPAVRSNCNNRHLVSGILTNTRARHLIARSQTNTLRLDIGTSANAGPHYQKLYARVTHIWGNRKGQPNRSAMKGPHLERTASLITVPPASGKYAIFRPSATDELPFS